MSDAEVTADNLTDAQIRALNTQLGKEMELVVGAAWAILSDLRGYCAIALGISRSTRVGFKTECKRMIADAINARAKAGKP